MPDKNRNFYGIFIFFLSIAFLWIVSFQVIGGKSGGDDEIVLEDNKEQNEPASGDSSSEVFSGKEDYPVFIVFDNHPDTRSYQSGISEAAVVYEFLVEGGATRFTGLYSGAPGAEKIGPIRSARPYVVQIASGWGAFFWHAGGSPEALDLIESGATDAVDLNEISSLGPVYFFRDESLPRPHNLFTSGDLIERGLEDFELYQASEDKLQWTWESAESKLSSGSREEGFFDTADKIYVDFSKGLKFDVQYKYNPESGEYLRSMSGIEHKDSLSGRQLSAANVIIKKVPAEGYYPSGYGRIKLDLTGEGDAILFQEGKMIQGTWKKESQNSQNKWFDADGKSLVLKEGQTWVEIVPGNRVVSFE